MEKKLIKLVNRMLKKDSSAYLWHKDELLKDHFKMGSPDGPYIECSWEVVNKKPIGKLVVYKNEHTQLRWSVKQGSELSEILYYLEQDASRLTKDQDYHKRLRQHNERIIQNDRMVDEVDLFFGIKRI